MHACWYRPPCMHACSFACWFLPPCMHPLCQQSEGAEHYCMDTLFAWPEYHAKCLPCFFASISTDSIAFFPTSIATMPAPSPAAKHHPPPAHLQQPRPFPSLPPLLLSPRAPHHPLPPARTPAQFLPPSQAQLPVPLRPPAPSQAHPPSQFSAPSPAQLPALPQAPSSLTRLAPPTWPASAPTSPTSYSPTHATPPATPTSSAREAPLPVA